MNNFDNKHLWHPYDKVPSKIPSYKLNSASGVYLNLDGNKVIDGMSSWWSVIHGYNHPVLNLALKSQVDNFSHIMFGGITHQSAIDLAKKLLLLLPQFEKIFFSDSGSVAIEVAMKMALQYWFNKGEKRTKFITIYGGYHGDTFGAMSICDPINGMHHMFKNFIAENIFVKQPNLNNTDEAIADLKIKLQKQHKNIAAMVLEPIVQGAGGINFYSPLYLKAVRELCDQFNILLIIDEIATGFGRTGKLFASNYANINADIMCIGKALTGGYLSLAATIVNAQIASGVGTLMHGPTFMANPLATKVASASIDLLLANDYQKNIKRIENILNEELLTLSGKKNIKDIRILGAIGVIEFNSKIAINTMQKTLIKQGVWLRPYNNLLYTMPPYIVSDKELKIITSAMLNVS